jgi:hypothetical protein
MDISILEKLFSNINEGSKSIAFITFAKQRNLNGNWAGLKDALYTKNHQQGELAGQTEAVEGVRFETEVNGQKGFVLMALSRNATNAGLQNIMKDPSKLQVRVEQYNGYENFTLCTGQSDREVSEVSGSFTI